MMNTMNTFKIRHTVVFKLKHPQGSPQEKIFLDAARELSSIPGVLRFECLREVSPKNNYDYGLSMEFESLQAYQAYQNNPAHDAFVQTYWAAHVKDFLEIDYEQFE
jgi:heme-degrading monooxygenase HmoA